MLSNENTKNSVKTQNCYLKRYVPLGGRMYHLWSALIYSQTWVWSNFWIQLTSYRKLIGQRNTQNYTKGVKLGNPAWENLQDYQFHQQINCQEKRAGGKLKNRVKNTFKTNTHNVDLFWLDLDSNKLLKNIKASAAITKLTTYIT